MDNISGKHLLKTLKCLDIETGIITNESLDWLFDKKETSDILTWLCTYLNENNIDTCVEYQQYNELKNEEQNLSKEYIENACEHYPVIDEILNINESHLNILKREIEIAKIKSDNLNKLTIQFLTVDGKLNRNLEDEEINLRVKHKSYLSQCMEHGKQVDKLHNEIVGGFEKFSNLFSNNIIREKYFISQMPLHSYQKQCEEFQMNLNLWMRKISGIAKFNYSKEEINNYDTELNRMYFKIRNSIIPYVKLECEQSELTTRLNYLRNCDINDTSKKLESREEIEYTNRVSFLQNELKTLYDNELQKAAETYSKNLINCTLIKNAELKLNYCRDILETLNVLHNEVIQALVQYELLFLLLKTDKVKIRNIHKFCEDFYFYSSGFLKNYSFRFHLMSEVENNVTKDANIFSEIISILTETHHNKSVTTKSVIAEIAKQQLTIENLENDLFITRSEKYLNNIKQAEQKILSTKKNIWCGPTLQPVIIPYEFLNILSISNYELQTVENSNKALLDEFNQAMATIKKNTWLTHRRRLWVWFLMKPEKIPAIIEQLKDYVALQARCNT